VLYVVHVIACYGHAQDIYHDIYHLSLILHNSLVS